MLWTFGFLNSRGQDATPPQVIPPTPNVASLAAVGNVPIGLYTGQPNVSFPLYQISYNDFTFPVSLSYNYNGLKLEEYPGWVGMGWTLQATGVITRQTRGIADERLNGYNGQNQRGLSVVSFINEGSNTSDPAYQGLLNGIKDGYIDSQPDLFVLSVPGLSGKFFFDETQCASTEMEGNLVIKHATIVPHQIIDVRGYFDYTAKYNIATGIIKKFEVTDERGIKYLFDVLEKAANLEENIDNGSADNDYGNAWYLSRITTPNNNSITFQYTNRVLDNPPTITEELLMPESFNSAPKFHVTSTTEMILDKIYFRNGVVDFLEDQNSRTDWNSLSWTYSRKQATEQPKALDKIKVTIGSNVIKEFDFEYSYFGGTRLRLDSFQEKNGTTSKPPHQFEYEPGTFPAIGNHDALFNQDHWGYYSGASNQTLLAPFFGSGNASFGAFSFSLAGNLRLPQHDFTKAGILTKIIYPTGGSTTFEYEPNDFFSFTPVTFLPPRGNFTALETATAATTLFIGEQEERKTITLNEYTYGKVNFTLQTANCGEGIASVRIVNLQTSATILHYYMYRDANGVDPTTYFGAEPNEVFILPPGEYEMIASASIESSCQGPITQIAKAIITYMAWIPDNSGANYLAGGLRVKKVTDCDANGSAGCISKFITYSDINDPARSSGVLISKPIYSHDITIAYVTGLWTVFETNAVVLSSNSQVPISSTQGSTIGYKYVTVMNEQNGSLGKAIHQFTTAENYPDSIDYTYPFPVNVSNDWKRGMETFERNFNSQDSLLISRESVYQPLTFYSRSIAIKSSPKIVVTNGTNYQMTINDFIFNDYDLRSGKMRMIEETTQSIESSTTLSTTSNYYYENPAHLQLTRSETFNSKGDALTTTMKYPDDISLITGLTTPEIQGIQTATNRVAVIEQQQFSNGGLLSTQRNLYNGPQLTRSLNSIANNPLTERYSINDYDSYGNILNYTTFQGDNNSYIYDAPAINPIAQIKNASVNEVFYTSFEEGDGNSAVGDSKSGNRSLNVVGIYNQSLNQLTPGTYLLSYWSKSSGQWTMQSSEVNVSGSSHTISIPGPAQIDEVRFHPAVALMTTFNYKPGVGMISQTDPNGLTTYYEYDSMSRAILIRDNDRNILSRNKYNYFKGQ